MKRRFVNACLSAATAALIAGPVAAGDETAEPKAVPAASVAAEATVKRKIREVLAAGDFNPEQVVHVPVFRKRSTESAAPPAWIKYLEKFFRGVASVLRAGVWIFAGIAVLIILWTAHRWMRVAGEGKAKAPDDLPVRVGALDIRPESLPDDVAAAAAALWSAGDAVGALSLLYRGALSALVTRFSAKIRASSTEPECVRAANACLADPQARYFEVLATTWQRTVYAGERPAQDIMSGLCAAYSGHFRQASGGAR